MVSQLGIRFAVTFVRRPMSQMFAQLLGGGFTVPVLLLRVAGRQGLSVDVDQRQLVEVLHVDHPQWLACDSRRIPLIPSTQVMIVSPHPHMLIHVPVGVHEALVVCDEVLWALTDRVPDELQVVVAAAGEEGLEVLI